MSTPCQYPRCTQPLPPTAPTGGRPRRYCSKRCSDRDYERTHPNRKHTRTRAAGPAVRRAPKPLPATTQDRYYDLKPEAIERRIAAAFAHIRRVGLPPRG